MTDDRWSELKDIVLEQLQSPLRPEDRRDVIMRCIAIYTNTRIEEVLDRLQGQRIIYVKHDEYIIELNEPPLVITRDYKRLIPQEAIEAERKQLKGGE